MVASPLDGFLLYNPATGRQAFQRGRMQKLLSSLALLLSTATVLPAQEWRATLVGRISDPTGVLVAGAIIRTTNPRDKLKSLHTSNESGSYEVPYLLPGLYRIEVEMAGFKKAVREDVELRFSDRLTLDLTMELGKVAESVVVTGETPLLETATRQTAGSGSRREDLLTF